MSNVGETFNVVSITPWDDLQCRVTATATTPREAIAVALTGLVAAYHNETRPRSQSPLATRALAFRAEEENLQTLIRGLIEAIFDVLAEDASNLEDIQFDGLIRTDDGLAGWGYVMVRPDAAQRPPITVLDVSADTDRYQTSLTVILGRD